MSTINIDLTNPVNTIRCLVGDVDICNPILSDMMYQQIIALYTNGSREECSIVWLSAIYAAQIILAHYAPDSMRYRERVNAVEIDYYGGERFKNYEKLIKWLKNNPPNYCDAGTTGGLFYFGGTYTECSSIYTLRYINSCLMDCWGCRWENGFYSSCAGV